MKANFKINKKDEFSNPDSIDFPTEDNTQSSFEEYVRTLPKGWNLWSLRNSSNKL